MSIPNLQPGTGTAGTIGIDKVCGIVWNGAADQAGTGTACSYSTPFRVGVHFDSSEALGPPSTTNAWIAIENMIGTLTQSEGTAYNGFYLAYFQNTC